MAAGVTCSFSSAVFFLLLLNCILFVSTNVDEVIDDGDENDRALGPSGYMKREYSAIKPFVGGTSMQFWEMKGDSLLTDDYIRLTPDQQSKSGAVWNTLPVMVRDWEVHVHFKVQGQNTRFFGDGFAFWYTKDRSELGPVFGAKDYHDGLSIFFDTYANQNGEHSHEHPYISAQINNGTTHYDHDKDGTHSALAGCTAHFRGVDAETHVAIRYLGSRKRLTVQHDMDDENKWAECFDRYGVELPTGYFLGFSSQTGDLSDNHDLISVKFYELASNDAEDDPAQYLNIQPKADGAEPERDHSEDDKVYTRKDRALNWFLGIVLVLIAIALLGFFYYQKMQRDNMKRFY